MSELLQYDGTKMVDYGPSTPARTPVSMADSSGKFVQVSDLRPGHPNAQTILTAAHKYPLPGTNTPTVGTWIPPLLLAKRRMWDGRRWMPGESTAKDVHPHAETNYTGSKLEFTQVLESGPSVGGPTIATLPNIGWTSTPRMRLVAQVGPGNAWVEYKEGTYHANNHHHVANGMMKNRAPIAGKPDEYRWNVAIGSGVAREIAGHWCYLLIDGEGEYGPFMLSFKAAVPWKIPTIGGLHALPTSTSNIKLTWTPVPGVTSYIISIGSTHRTVSAASVKAGYNWGGLREHTRYTFTIQGVGPGWKTPVRTVAQTTKTHTPVSHTVTVPDLWTGAYDENHRRRSDHPSNPWQGDLVTGKYGSVHGNTYSVTRFKDSVIPAGAHVTSVKLRLYAKHWFMNSGGSAKIRNIAVASTVRTRYTAKTSGHITYIKWTTKTGYKEASIATTQAQKDAWRSGGPVNAIQIGPPGSGAQSHYGVFAGSGSRKPRLIVKYTI